MDGEAILAGFVWIRTRLEGDGVSVAGGLCGGEACKFSGQCGLVERGVLPARLELGPAHVGRLFRHDGANEMIGVM